MPDRVRSRTAIAHRWLIAGAGLVLVPLPACALDLAGGGASNAQAATLFVVVAGLLAFSLTAAALYVRERSLSAAASAAARVEVGAYKVALERCHALLDGEPGARVILDQGGLASRVFGDAGFLGRREGDGLPPPEDWLDQASAAELRGSLEGLHARGEPFRLALRAIDGRTIEARGRAASGHAILHLDDLEGERQERIELAEEAARHARAAETLRRLVDSLPIPAWERDHAGRLIWVNLAYATVVGALSAEAAVASGAEFLDEATRLHLLQHRAAGGLARAAFASAHPRSYTVLEVSSPTGSAGTAMDVTDIEDARAEVARQIAAQARTLDQLTTAVAIFGPDRRLKFFNAAYRELFDLDPVWLGSGPDDNAILDRLRVENKLPEQADYKSWKKGLLEVYRGRKPSEHWWYLPGRTLRVVASPDPQGGVVYMYENHTERLSLESRYNALSRVQGETLDNLREGVAVFSSDGRLRLSNPSFAQIWQLSPAMLGDRPHVDQVLARCAALGAGESWERIKRVVTALGDRHPINGRTERLDAQVVDFVAQPLPDGATLVTFADVTAGVAMQRALEERNEALEAADRLKNTFVQHVSYELRSPLTNIIGFAELLSDARTGRLTKRQKEYTGHIQTSSTALLAIINDILDLATIDAGAMELDLEDVGIGEAMEAAADGVRDRLAEAELTLDIEAGSGLGAFRADGKRLRQILFNLLANAVSSSGRGGRVVLSADRRDGEVRFTVRDEGCGIAPEQLATVFDRFETWGQGGSRRRGVGLGLSIVRSFVELHGGTISVESEVGRGTQVTCSFPDAEALVIEPLRVAS